MLALGACARLVGVDADLSEPQHDRQLILHVVECGRRQLRLRLDRHALGFPLVSHRCGEYRAIIQIRTVRADGDGVMSLTTDRCADAAPGAGGARIVMIEDHDMVAAALGGVLDAQSDFDVVAIASDVDQALAAVTRHQPDVIVTDLRLAAGDVIEHLPELTRRSPQSRVLVVTGSPNEKALLDALEAGALGFIVKAQPMTELVDAVRRVARGELVVAPELAPALMSRLDGARRDPAVLSRRELEVVGLLAAGRSTQDIAAELFLSPNTIRNHIARSMAKLDVHSRLEVVAEASRRGLIAGLR